jgi:hypothetical protein
VWGRLREGAAFFSAENEKMSTKKVQKKCSFCSKSAEKTENEHKRTSKKRKEGEAETP